MDIASARVLIDEMAEHAPVQVVPFFRGESLLNKDWREILAYVKAKRVGPVQFTTNATLLDREAAAKLADLNLDFISFSMDTIDPQLYESTRRGADYEKCLANVLGFLEERERRKADTVVQVSAVETDAHRPRMDEFVEYWRPKVDKVRVYVEHSANGSPGGIDAPLPKFDSRRPCRKLFTDMVIYWNGEAAVCNHDWARLVDGPRIGNVFDSGIARVWRTESLEPCRGCDHWKMYYMESGFLGRAYEGTGGVKCAGPPETRTGRCAV
jgi:MoaA/NifB/PqqE/SkfB family radical SAM enzyme